MTKRKRRNAVTLVSLLLVLVALIAFYFWYMNRDTDSTEDQDNNISLATLDPEQITSLRYKAKDADLTLIKEGELWKSEEQPDRPINQDHVESIINTVKVVNASRIISETTENLQDYGLDNPVAYVCATQKDGVTLTIQIGNRVSTKDGYYAMVNEDGKIYLLPTSYGSGLQYNDIDMTAVDETISFASEDIYYLKVDNRDGEDYEFVYDTNNSFDKTDSLYPWLIKQPYDEGYTADTSDLMELFGNYTSFDFGTCVDYSGKEFGKYGLEEPSHTIDIGYYETRTEALPTPEVDENTGEEITQKTYKDEKSLTLYIGNTDGNGNYYVRKEGSNLVQTMKEDTINKMLQVDVFSVINTFVCLPNIDTVDRISADIEGKSYVMEIKRSKDKDEEGKEITKATYYYNGEEVEEDVFKDVYQEVVSAQYDAEMKKDMGIGQGKPYLTISYQLNDENKTIKTASYFLYDDSFYAVDSGHGIRFLADKRKIDDIAAAIINFKTTEE